VAVDVKAVKVCWNLEKQCRQESGLCSLAIRQEDSGEGEDGMEEMARSMDPHKKAPKDDTAQKEGQRSWSIWCRR
jgi:hypothetical protein